MEEKISITPVIQSGKIISVEVQDVSLPLKKDLSIDELPKLVEAIEEFFKYVDIERFGELVEEEEEEFEEWDEEALRNFVLTRLSDRQALALKVLTESKEVTREEFIEKMRKLLNNNKFRGWDLGGLLGGITNKSQSLGYESPYRREWRTVGDEWYCFYSLTREKYREIIDKALKERR